MIGFDRYDNLKGQCSICKDIGGATEEDCLNCPKRAVIRQYEDRMQEPRLSMFLYSARNLTGLASTRLSDTEKNTFEVSA